MVSLVMISRTGRGSSIEPMSENGFRSGGHARKRSLLVTSPHSTLSPSTTGTWRMRRLPSSRAAVETLSSGPTVATSRLIQSATSTVRSSAERGGFYMAAPVQATAKPMDEETMRRLNRRPPKGNEGVGRTLNGLLSYTVEHFKREEQLFAKTGYSESAAHTKEHQNLCKQVADPREAQPDPLDATSSLASRSWRSRDTAATRSWNWVGSGLDSTVGRRVGEFAVPRFHTVGWGSQISSVGDHECRRPGITTCRSARE